LTDQLFTFPPQLRLATPLDYKQVFENPVKSTDNFFTLLAIQNNLDNPRLGLAIAKKNVRLAVARNLIKRTVRESFRQHQHQLVNIDVVVLARRDAVNISPDLLRKSLTKHWFRLNKRCESYS